MKKKTPELIQFERKFALVAGMSGDERTVSHVRELLRSADISCTYEGSVLYGLYVDRSKVDQAVELLRAEKIKGWKIFFLDEFDGLAKRSSEGLRRR